MPIEQEVQWFEAHRAELLKTYLGKFVLIKGEAVMGSFDSAQAAYEAGVKSYGLGAFLVKQVLPADPVQQMPAVSVGALRAST